MSIVKITRNGKQAEVVEKYLPEFLKDGWSIVADSSDPKGDELELKVIESDSKEDIEKLIKDLFDVDLDKRLSLDNMKEKALAVINESKRVD